MGFPWHWLACVCGTPEEPGEPLRPPASTGHSSAANAQPAAGGSAVAQKLQMLEAGGGRPAFDAMLLRGQLNAAPSGQRELISREIESRLARWQAQRAHDALVQGLNEEFACIDLIPPHPNLIAANERYERARQLVQTPLGGDEDVGRLGDARAEYAAASMALMSAWSNSGLANTNYYRTAANGLRKARLGLL